MKLGFFMMPAHPPDRLPYDYQQYDLQSLRWADELDFSEAWIGEHYTVAWEPNPAPDLTIAQALLQTTKIKLAPGAHLLPYHHPVELAHRVAFLDHLAQGRLMLGIGAGGHEGDWMAFGVDGKNNEHRRMMVEALDIMLGIWKSEGEFKYDGQWWKVHIPPSMVNGQYRHHLFPYQKPHPPIGVAALTPRSSTLKFAGERGFMPLSINLNLDYTAGHWETYSEAAEGAGHKADRAEWRVYNEVLVADTDAEAERLFKNGALGQVASDYLLELYGEFGFLQHFKLDKSLPDSAINADYVMRNTWFVGSVNTVVDKLVDAQKRVGGFGTLLMSPTDWGNQPEILHHSMELMAKEVLPRVEAKLAPVAATA